MNRSYEGKPFIAHVAEAYKERGMIMKPKKSKLTFLEVIGAVLLLIVVLLVQSTFGIDSLLTAVAGALAGAIVVFFGGKMFGKEKEG